MTTRRIEPNAVDMDLANFARPLPATDDVRATALSIKASTHSAIGHLDGLISQSGEYADLASEMRSIYAEFDKMADDLLAASQIVSANKNIE